MASDTSSKKRRAAPAPPPAAKKARKVTPNEKAQTTSTKPKVQDIPVPAVADTPGGETLIDEEEGEEEEDDQTAALLKGFESPSEEEDNDETDGVEIKDIPAIPESVELQSKLSAAAQRSQKEPGVVYLGRIPHGFYEHQMRSYFAQFGDISRLRLSRNRKTGASKHYAFIEFSHEEVAKIVADTMNNYLMFGHILKAKLIAKDQVHENLFRGAGTRFKKIPWNRIERFQLQGADRAGWQKRVEHEKSRRDKKAAQLKELGYEFNSPQLRDVDDVPVQTVRIGEKEETVNTEVPKEIEEKPIEEPAQAPVSIENSTKKTKSPKDGGVEKIGNYKGGKKSSKRA